tara:strand:+ start:274 stop:519 length:246 start_codon:yes stop_codon:yes gene_type:complete
MTFDREFQVSTHYLPFFINDEPLDESNQSLVEEFFNRETEHLKTLGSQSWHWSYEGDGSDFGKCEICGLGANLVTLQLVIV